MTDTTITGPVIDIIFAEVGPQGPPGPRGPAGVAGGAWTWEQAVASTLWDVTHPLEFQPNVMVVDSAGTAVYGDVIYLDPHHLQISFSVPFAGIALLS